MLGTNVNRNKFIVKKILTNERTVGRIEMPVIEKTVVVGRSTMEKAKTRDEILKVALDLFSVNGYEATSISQIADAVGIRKASLYSHYEKRLFTATSAANRRYSIMLWHQY